MTANEYQLNIVGSGGTYYFQSYELVAINVPAGGTAEYEVQASGDVFNTIIQSGTSRDQIRIEMTYQYNAKLYEKTIQVAY